MNSPIEKIKTKTYKANQELQQKAGKGPIDPQLIVKAQRVIEENNVDFVPLGLQFLSELEEALTQINDHADTKQSTEQKDKQKKMLTNPVMELKANATTFHYPLVGNLAGIMLSFLESINELDKEAISIVRSHHDTLKTIITDKKSGDGGESGKKYMLELKETCARYYKNKKK